MCANLFRTMDNYTNIIALQDKRSGWFEFENLEGFIFEVKSHILNAKLTMNDSSTT